jgi:hypothetical protein
MKVLIGIDRKMALFEGSWIPGTEPRLVVVDSRSGDESTGMRVPGGGLQIRQYGPPRSTHQVLQRRPVSFSQQHRHFSIRNDLIGTAILVPDCNPKLSGVFFDNFRNYREQGIRYDTDRDH